MHTYIPLTETDRLLSLGIGFICELQSLAKNQILWQHVIIASAVYLVVFCFVRHP